MEAPVVGRGLSPGLAGGPRLESFVVNRRMRNGRSLAARSVESPWLSLRPLPPWRPGRRFSLVTRLSSARWAALGAP
eukprot:6877942-Alexandrium_andersonii.AAC.1